MLFLAESMVVQRPQHLLMKLCLTVLVTSLVQVGNLTGLGQNGFDDDVAGTPATDAIPGTPANYGSPNVDFVSMYRKERGKDGWVKGHWAQSTEIYLSGHKGTPGTSERGAVGTIGATGFTVGACNLQRDCQ